MEHQLQALQGGVAVITGAGSGIGEALARQTAAMGMPTVLADIAEERVHAVAAEIQSQGGRALAVATDVSDPEAMDALASITEDTFGTARLLINNAGVETLGFSWELPPETWRRSQGVNVDGVINGVRAFMPQMIASGEPAFIANTSSLGGLATMPVQTAYIVSKHAVLAFSECLRLEMQVKALPISVSAILPGPIATPIFRDAAGAGDPVSEAHREMMRAMIEGGGMSPEEAAGIILPQIAAGSLTSVATARARPPCD